MVSGGGDYPIAGCVQGANCNIIIQWNIRGYKNNHLW